MTDKELLEAAAKVSGIDLNDYEWIEGDGVGTYFMAAGDASHDWNPLENDGDAFRLMVDLCLAVHCDEEGAQVWHSHDVCGSYGFAECDVSDSCDKKQAVRRAIVMSAVEIGKCK